MTSWQRSSFCSAGGCPEVARRGGRVEIRDSQRQAEVAWFSEEDWALFLAAVKAGEFDGPTVAS